MTEIKPQNKIEPAVEQTKKRVGRPSKYNDDYALRLLALMEDGLSFEACCGDLGITKDTGYRWAKEYPEFGHAKDLGEVRGQLFWEKAAISGMWSDKESRFNTTAFIFVMKNRFNWKDKKELSGNLELGITGNVENLYKNWSLDQMQRAVGDILTRMPKPEGPKRS